MNKTTNLLRAMMFVLCAMGSSVYGMGWFSQETFNSLYGQVAQGASMFGAVASDVVSSVSFVDGAETVSAIAEKLSQTGSSLLDGARMATDTAKEYVPEVDLELITQKANNALLYASSQGKAALAQASWTPQGQAVLAYINSNHSIDPKDCVDLEDDWQEVVVERKVPVLGGRTSVVITKTKGYIKPNESVKESKQKIRSDEICKRLDEGSFKLEVTDSQNQVLPSFFAAKKLTANGFFVLTKRRTSQRAQKVQAF